MGACPTHSRGVFRNRPRKASLARIANQTTTCTVRAKSMDRFGNKRAGQGAAPKGAALSDSWPAFHMCSVTGSRFRMAENGARPLRGISAARYILRSRKSRVLPACMPGLESKGGRPEAQRPKREQRFPTILRPSEWQLRLVRWTSHLIAFRQTWTACRSRPCPCRPVQAAT